MLFSKNTRSDKFFKTWLKTALNIYKLITSTEMVKVRSMHTKYKTFLPKLLRGDMPGFSNIFFNYLIRLIKLRTERRFVISVVIVN
jgi:hypothetical protein